MWLVFECEILHFVSPGLLTEVQCQSKRLRKGGKGRGQEEEDNTDSRRVSSTSRLPGQVKDSRTGWLPEWMAVGYIGCSESCNKTFSNSRTV